MSFNTDGNLGEDFFGNAIDLTMDPTLSVQPLYYDDSLNVGYNVSNNDDLSQILDDPPQYGFAEANWNQGQVQAYNNLRAPHVPNNYQNQRAHSGYGPQSAGAVDHQTEHSYSGAGSAVAPTSYQNIYAPPEGSAQPSQKRRASSSSESTEESPEQQQPAPKKRRKNRKSKKMLSETEQEVKRERFLERNRTAASKCRMRKKEMNEELQRNYEALGEENRALYRQLESLRQEIHLTKTALYSHAECKELNVEQWMKKERAKAFDGVPTPKQLSNSMQRTESFNKFKGKYQRMMGGDETQSVPMSRLNSSESLMVETMSRQESTNSQQGATKMSPQFSSQSSNVETLIDSGISTMGSPSKIKAEAKSPFDDEGYSGQPMMQNQRLPQGMVGGLQGMDNPGDYLARTGLPLGVLQYPPHPM